MNAANVTRLLTYLEQLKASGEEDKWEMSEYLADREDHDVLFPHEVTNWHCGTAGCLAGSWAIINVKDGRSSLLGSCRRSPKGSVTTSSCVTEIEVMSSMVAGHAMACMPHSTRP
jgi:hypothetical protein